jgi:multidrug efflux pump subunit AcrA (membrane-fusion protein)
MENDIQELRATLRSEQATYDLKKLEVERGQFESENKRKINELEFRQSTIRLNRAKRQLERKPLLNGYDYKVQKIKIIQGESGLADAREVLNRMVIISPADGMFQVGQTRWEWPPKDLKVGDRVGSGSLIARLPDISHMKVRTSVNETDISKINLGMKVLVRLDALPEVPFHGVISEIGRACIVNQENKEKVFKVVVVIGESDLRLKPGMTVSCEYICYETEEALFVPNSCLLKESGKSYIFLKQGGVTKKTEVTTGPSNSNHTIINGTYEPGQFLVPFENVLNEKKI